MPNTILTPATTVAFAVGSVPASAAPVPGSAIPRSSTSQAHPVQSSRDELQKQIDEVLNATKGGRQTALNQVTLTTSKGSEVQLAVSRGFSTGW